VLTKDKVTQCIYQLKLQCSLHVGVIFSYVYYGCAISSTQNRSFAFVDWTFYDRSIYDQNVRDLAPNRSFTDCVWSFRPNVYRTNVNRT